MYTLRIWTASLLAPCLAYRRFRFSTEYRHGTTRYHRTVYRLTNTVLCNTLADDIAHYLHTKKNK